MSRQKTLGSTAATSGLATAFGFGLSQVIRLSGNIVAAALLFEEAFALVAISMAVIQGLAMFSDFGIGPSVVQHRRGDEPAFLNTAWTLQVLRGLLLALLAAMLGWPLATLYGANEPMAQELVWLLPLAAFSTVITAFNSPAMLSAARHVQLLKVTAIELLSQVAGVAVMLFVAWKTGEVYSLVIGGVFGSVVTLTLGYIWIGGRWPHFMVDRAAFWDIFHFGKWIFLSTVLTFLALQLDKFLFPAVFPLAETGVYIIAATFSALAPALLGRLQLMVAFPVYSRVSLDSTALRRAFDISRRIILALGAVIAAAMIGCAEVFINLAYDDRYSRASLYIPLLALGAWFVVLEGLYGAVFLATARARWIVLTNLAKVCAFVLFFFFAVNAESMFLAVCAVAAADLVKAIVAISLAHRLGLAEVIGDLMWTLYTIAVGVAVHALGSVLLAQDNWHPLTILLIQGLGVLMLFGWCLYRGYRSLLELRLLESNPGLGET